MKKGFIIITAVLLMQISIAQTITVEQYIQQNKDLAIREMKRMGIPASITLAQGILETQNGNSDLVKKSNNHFGIKCKSTWTSMGVSHDDDAAGECFRWYKTAEDSYRDHSNFLRGSERYAFLFKLDPKDYKGWAHGLKKAGYATNPRYPQILIKFIEAHNLEQYTMEAVNEVPVYDASKYTSDPEEKAFDELIQTTGGTSNSTPAGSAPSNGLQEFENKIVINGSSAVAAKKGTSLLAIASENNINLSRLLEYNDMRQDGLLEKDQIVFLEKKAKEGENDFYIMQQGEALYDVAQKTGVRLQSLYEYNPSLNNNNPVAGSRINLRAVNTEDLKQNVTAAVQKVHAVQLNQNENETTGIEKVHAVQPKEGLYAISRKYGVTISQLKEWNKLPDDTLKIGQQLIISISK